MFVVAIYILLICSVAAMQEEPRCSKFEFEKNLLEMLVRLEFKMDTTAKKLDNVEEKFKQQYEEQHKALAQWDEKAMQRFEVLEERLKRDSDLHKAPLVYFFVNSPRSSVLHEKRPIFKKVVQNVGDSYDIDTGLFTCKIEGLYHFAFNVISTSTNTVYCYLHRNGGQITYTYANGAHNSGSVVVNLYLLFGDTVEMICAANFVNVELSSGVFFTGALVR